jgi:hypothetical protein
MALEDKSPEVEDSLVELGDELPEGDHLKSRSAIIEPRVS